MNGEIRRYKKLNELAEPSGIVIFGGREDINIPLGELRQAFEVEPKMYNRSIAELSVKDAAWAYDECAASLEPDTVLLHIGRADLTFFEEDPSEFDRNYRELIAHIKTCNPKCCIAVVSLQNYDENAQIEKVNTHLKYMADSENCEYADIAAKKVWNPKGLKDALEFVCSMGFVRPLKRRRPVCDLVKMLFCYES